MYILLYKNKRIAKRSNLLDIFKIIYQTSCNIDGKHYRVYSEFFKIIDTEHKNRFIDAYELTDDDRFSLAIFYEKIAHEGYYFKTYDYIERMTKLGIYKPYIK